MSARSPRIIFSGVLDDDEEIVWVGQPVVAAQFNRADLLLIPLGGLIAILSVLFVVYALISLAALGVLLPLLGLIFCGLGVYLAVGRLFVKRALKARTFYALTNRRVLILIDGTRPDVKAIPFTEIAEMHDNADDTGFGTVWFGKASAWTLGNSGLAPFVSPPPVPTFHDIRGARQVHAIALAVQRGTYTRPDDTPEPVFDADPSGAMPRKFRPRPISKDDEPAKPFSFMN